MKLSLYYPVSPVYVNQGFGVNGDYYKANGINIIGHNGIDFAAKHGEPIYAVHDGEAWYEIDEDQGHGVVLRTTGLFDYESSQVRFKSIYWHMCDSTKEPQFKSPIEAYMDVGKPGKPIKAGDIIGYADSTGLSTGDHLHFGLKPVAQNETDGSFYNPAQNNGYLGAIDPTPYFNGIYAGNLSSTKHTFYISMKLGDSGSEVLALQRSLQSIGYFPKDAECTGFYGTVTKQSVFSFQRDHCITGVMSFIQVWTSMGNNVGPLTIPALNKVFA